MAFTGAWLQLGALLGVGATIYGMVRAFKQIAAESQVDPQVLADNISASLTSTMIGLPFALVGLILMAIALFGMKYRATWFFWFLTIYGVLLLPGFPLGTLLGIGLLIFLIVKKDEFLAPASSAATN
nr:MotA/TolQ/ExbB proton channel family protein [Ruficoccus amylovorans]